MEEYAGVYKLWGKVLEQAQDEANGNWAWTVGRTDEVKRQVCREAQDWLTIDSPHLRWVCKAARKKDGSQWDIDTLLRESRKLYGLSLWGLGEAKTCQMCDVFQQVLAFCWEQSMRRLQETGKDEGNG